MMTIYSESAPVKSSSGTHCKDLIFPYLDVVVFSFTCFHLEGYLVNRCHCLSQINITNIC